MFRVSNLVGVLAILAFLLTIFNLVAVGGVAKERRRAQQKIPHRSHHKQKQHEEEDNQEEDYKINDDGSEANIENSKRNCDVNYDVDSEQLEKEYWKLLSSFQDSKDVEQSSAKFKDYPKKSPKWNVPSQSKSVTGNCSTTEMFESVKTDSECHKFLSNFKNWKSIQTLPSVLSIARTIKFIVTFIDGTQGVLKIPQKKFLFEPYSEYISFEADRELGFNKIPNTALIPLPVSWLRSVASTLDDGFYAYWIEHFVFNFGAVKKNIAKGRCPFPEQETIMCSIQIWMSGVEILHATQYRPKGAMKKLQSLSDNLIVENERKALSELSNMLVFDFIISNSDRSAKNTFAITSGSHTSVVLIDQGSSFYSRDPPRGHPLRHTAKHSASVCVFSSNTIHTLQKYSKKDLFKKNMMIRLRSAAGFWKTWQIKSAQQRIITLMGVIKYCEETYPDAVRSGEMSVGTLLGCVTDCGSKIQVDGFTELITITDNEKGTSGDTTGCLLLDNSKFLEAKLIPATAIKGDLTCIAVRKRLPDIPLAAHSAAITTPYELYLVHSDVLALTTSTLQGYKIKTLKVPSVVTYVDLSQSTIDRRTIIQSNISYEGSPGSGFTLGDDQTLPVVVSAYLFPDTPAPVMYLGKLSSDGCLIVPCGCVSLRDGVNRIKTGNVVLDSLPDDSPADHNTSNVNIFCNRVVVREGPSGWEILFSQSQFLQLCATFTLNNSVVKFDTGAASPSASYIQYQPSVPRRRGEPNGQRQRAPPKSPPAPPKQQLKRRKQ